MRDMRIIFSILIMMGIFACSGQETTDNDPPSAPVMVLKDAGDDTLAIERGIDAVPGLSDNYKIQIMWFSHPEGRNLSKFNVYRSTDREGKILYKEIGSVKVDNASFQDTAYVDVLLNTNIPYFYYVTAEDEQGNESLPSDTVWYQLTEKAQLVTPKGTIITNPPIVFEFVKQGIPNGYILRIEKDLGLQVNPLAYVEWVEPLKDYATSIITDSLSGEQLKTIFSNGNYRWRIDLFEIDPLHYGSESNWETFTINWSDQ